MSVTTDESTWYDEETCPGNSCKETDLYKIGSRHIQGTKSSKLRNPSRTVVAGDSARMNVRRGVELYTF